jgi:hypothetical protein
LEADLLSMKLDDEGYLFHFALVQLVMITGKNNQYGWKNVGAETELF